MFDKAAPPLGPTPPPWTEAERLAALRGLGLLDTEREPAFDDFVKLAKLICGTSIAVVNLVDESRQWFKAESGLGLRETPLNVSICSHVILQSDLVVIPDATKDPRFDCNPLVTGPPYLRFYAGALLVTEAGLPLGTLCVLDSIARPEGLTPTQREGLAALARQVMTQIELRRALHERMHAEATLTIADRRIRDVLNSIDNPFFVVDRDFMVTYANRHVMNAIGRTMPDIIGASLFTLFPDVEQLSSTDGMRFLTEVMHQRRSAQRELYSNALQCWCDMSVYPMSDGGLAVYIKNIDQRKQMEHELAAAAAQKEVLMLETHHRVKNSLQMVQSLLTLQARTIADPAIANMMQESAARVRTFGALHETLYTIADGTHVDLETYLALLVADLRDGIGATLTGRPITLDVQPTKWPSSDVSMLGLVLTELVTNALKYGTGGVRVGVTTGQDQQATLTVEDEGTALAADFIPGKGSGIGMRLIMRLLRDRDGRLEIDRSVHHTRFIVHLPAPIVRQSGRTA